MRLIKSNEDYCYTAVALSPNKNNSCPVALGPRVHTLPFVCVLPRSGCIGVECQHHLGVMKYALV